MNSTLTIPTIPHSAACCSCPACRVATTPAGAANIANWNNYATAFGPASLDAEECAICGDFESAQDMETYATRRICPDCRMDLVSESDRIRAADLTAMMLEDSRYAWAEGGAL